MGSEYMGLYPDPSQSSQISTKPQPPTAPSAPAREENIRPTPQVVPTVPLSSNDRGHGQEPSYREHVSGALYVPASEAPHFRPAYQPAPQPPVQGQPYRPGPYPYPYQQPGAPYPPGAYGQVPPGVQPGRPPAGYPYYNGQANGYYYPGYGYPPYPYGYMWPPKPKRDGYLLGISITSFVGSILIGLGGLACLGFLILYIIIISNGGLSNSSNPALRPDMQFAAMLQFVAFTCAGLLGGGFGLYHSIRSLFLKRPSAQLKLPRFWIFLVLDVVVLGIALALRAADLAVSNLLLTVVLIALAGILPAATIFSLAVRRLHFPRSLPWPTSWRRFALAITSGATSAIVLALIFELILTVAAERAFGIHNISLDDPNQPIPNEPRAIAFLFVLVSVIAPLVEEAVKPLAVVALIGRIRSATEAFVLGMACGIGFDLVETTGYIGMGYKNWVDVAIQRTSAGLLHGFGAAMVALGWYLITHKGSTGRYNRVLLALGCWAYAILQHGIWNGSFVFQMLPAPIGPYLDHGTIDLGFVTLPSFMLVYVVETIIMLLIFFRVTGLLRKQQTTTTTTQTNNNLPPLPANSSPMQEPARAPQFVAPR